MRDLITDLDLKVLSQVWQSPFRSFKSGRKMLNSQTISRTWTCKTATLPEERSELEKFWSILHSSTWLFVLFSSMDRYIIWTQIMTELCTGNWNTRLMLCFLSSSGEGSFQVCGRACEYLNIHHRLCFSWFFPIFMRFFFFFAYSPWFFETGPCSVFLASLELPV